jgi:hypothetical protein
MSKKRKKKGKGKEGPSAPIPPFASTCVHDFKLL